jgi:aryl-alcohol dehydrogenase
MKITAAICREYNAPLSIETIDLEEPRDTEVLVRVIATGVCHTDMVVRDGHLPTPTPVVLGHEGAGIVEKVGSAVTNVAPGDHIVMTFNHCGTCPSCNEKDVAYCHEFFPRNFFATRMDGSTALSKDAETIHGNFFGQSSFATHAICHAQNAIKVPKNVPLEYLGPLACGVQTGAGAVINALEVSVGNSLLVFGAGSVGLSAIMAAKVIGATKIIAVDINSSRLEFAKSIGATHAINSSDVASISDAILELTGTGVNYALDTTGLTPVIREAALCLAPRGTLGILGAAPMGTEMSFDNVHFMSGGRKLIGIVEGSTNPSVFIPKLIELYRQGRFPFDKMVKFYNFEQINDAINDSINGSAIKPILKMP